jgi:uncharacterized SAM-binding protein YcdF (DUF218 family)
LAKLLVQPGDEQGLTAGQYLTTGGVLAQATRASGVVTQAGDRRGIANRLLERQMRVVDAAELRSQRISPARRGPDQSKEW